MIRSPQIKRLREGLDKSVIMKLAFLGEASHQEERNHDDVEEEEKHHDLRVVGNGLDRIA